MALISSDSRPKTNVIFILASILCIGALICILWKLTEITAEIDKEIRSSSQTSPWTVADWEIEQNLERDLKKIEHGPRLGDQEKAEALLNIYPVFDAHNHFPWNLHKILDNNLDKFNFSSDLRKMDPRSQTDLPRLRKGLVRAQIWVTYADCQDSGKDDAVVQTLEQIDVINMLVEKYPNDLQLCTTAQCVMETSWSKNGRKIASLIGVEGGHSIHYSAGVLRQMYTLGVRYLRLTRSCSTPWGNGSHADDMSNNKNIRQPGLNEGRTWWGLELIDEMNRIGMIVELSHVAEDIMIQALKRSKAPVILSRAGVKAFCKEPFNMGDDFLRLLKKNGGLVMISFNDNSVYREGNPRYVTLKDVAGHMGRIRDLIGVDHIGLGAEFDGMGSPARGLQDVSKYPHLFACLIRLGWRMSDLKKISSTNLLRVMQAVEQVKGEFVRKIGTFGQRNGTKELDEKGHLVEGGAEEPQKNKKSGRGGGRLIKNRPFSIHIG